MGYQNWATPPEFIAWVEREVLPTYGFTRFGLDACAEPGNAKAPYYFAAQGETTDTCIGIDGLKQSWAGYGAVWCNPGFSACGAWLGKANAEHDASDITAVVMTHATHSTEWYQKHASNPWVDRWLVWPRVNFLPPPGVQGDSNPRDSMLWVFSPVATGRVVECGHWRTPKWMT
jgi:hypothetical protein